LLIAYPARGSGLTEAAHEQTIDDFVENEPSGWNLSTGYRLSVSSTYVKRFGG
jgi:hypothetical protein